MELTITTDFLGGNGKILGHRAIADGWEIEFLAESKKLEPMPLWFHLTAECHGAKRLRFILKNAQQCLGKMEDWVHNAPVYRADASEWHRCSEVQLESAQGHVSVAVFEIPVEGLSVELAFCYPYQQENVDALLGENSPWTPRTIGYSLNGRPMIRYTTEETPSKPGIYMIARQHSGETSGGWVLDGLMRRVSELKGAHLREKLQWWAVPIADPDGVEEGCYGKDHYPHDLNRSWSSPSPRVEVKALQMDLMHWRQQVTPFAIIDFHSPSHGERGFYFYVPDEPELVKNRSERFAEEFYQSIPPHLRGKEVSRVSSKLRTSAQEGMKLSEYAIRHFREYPMVMFTLEISYQGAAEAYTIEDYQLMGSNLADVLYRFFVQETEAGLDTIKAE
jgi:hypothetical protein